MISLDMVAALVHSELPDIPAYVDMTGGNTATVYVGEHYWIKDGEAIFGVAEAPLDADIFACVIGGPGVYRPSPPEANIEEFSIGYDINDPDDSIARVSVSAWELMPPGDEVTIARRMCQLWRDHPRVRS